MGLVALRHVGSSQTRAQTRVPCIGRQTLNHCATREALVYSFMSFQRCIESCIPYHSTMQKSAITLKIPLCDTSLVNDSPYCQSLATTNLFFISLVCPFTDCHVNEIIEYIDCGVWLQSFSKIHLKFSHVDKSTILQ